MKYAIVSGTNRPGSMTRRFSGFVESELKKLCGTSDQVDLIDLKEMPLDIFKPESYAEKPASFQSFSQRFVEADALVIVLPEYNGAAPGVFKYFVDMLPFPKALYKIPCTFFGVAAGRFGAVRSVEQIQQVFQYRNALVYPENLFIPGVDKNITEAGAPADDFSRKLFDQFLKGFVDFAKATAPLKEHSAS